MNILELVAFLPFASIVIGCIILGLYGVATCLHMAASLCAGERTQ